jgi:hypothetical protein
VSYFSAFLLLVLSLSLLLFLRRFLLSRSCKNTVLDALSMDSFPHIVRIKDPPFSPTTSLPCSFHACYFFFVQTNRPSPSVYFLTSPRIVFLWFLFQDSWNKNKKTGGGGDVSGLTRRSLLHGVSNDDRLFYRLFLQEIGQVVGHIGIVVFL